MEKSSLNHKMWYRALKVIFVASFILSQIFGFLFIHTVISEMYPEQQTITSTQYNEMRIKGLEDKTIRILAETKGHVMFDEISQPQENNILILQKLITYLLVFGIISCLFWLVMKTFFYIVCGEKFSIMFLRKK